MSRQDGEKHKRKRQIGIKNSGGVKHVNWKWITLITISAFFLSVFISIASTVAMEKVTGILVAVLVLLLIVSIGILFDIIGVAVQAAEEKPFHSMAARKVRGANHSITIIRNAEKVSSFCNDVVGDIAGIISGSTVAVVLVFFVKMFEGVSQIVMSLMLTGFVSALTIGGKALGKTLAMNHSNTIVYVVGLIASIFDFRKRK